MQPETTPGQLAADDARQRGNLLYKQGKLTEAESAYRQASRLAPQDARPLSNLAAVYFELAKYAECAETCRRSLGLIGEDSQEPTADKIRIRLVKSLGFSNKLREADAVLSSIASEESREGLRLSLSRALRLPHTQREKTVVRGKLIDGIARYRPPLQDEPEYFSVGHDTANTMVPDTLLKTVSREISCLCCGIGDARNLFTTILYMGLSFARQNVHFTLVDLKPAVFARDLLVFRLLFDMQEESDAASEETEVALCYVFAAQIMPNWAFDRLQACISAVIADLKRASQNPMGIFYIPGPVRKRIIRVLVQWQQPPRTCPDAKGYGEWHVMLPPQHLLQKHEARFWKLFLAYAKSRTSNNRKAVEDYLDASWKPNVTLVDLDFETKREDGPDPLMDFTPHEVVMSLFAAVPYQVVQCSPGVVNYFAGFFRLVSRVLKPMARSQITIEVVLGEMATTLERLRYGILRQGQKRIQRLDPNKFPDRYDGIDLSNIPDYVGGALTTLLHGVPILKQPGVSCLKSYVLRNTPAWVTHDQFLAEYLLMADRHLIKSHFLSVLKPKSSEIEKILSGKLVNGGGCVMAPGFEWERSAPSGAPLAAGTSMSRAKLELWLHAHFLKLCLPFPRERLGNNLVMAPLNMSSFFHLVSHVATLGYPPHWLSATLATLTSGVLVKSRAGPPTAIVTDEKLAAKSWPPVDICIAPFAAEFRTLLALWEPVIGVPVVFDSDKDPGSRIPERTAIRKFAVQFPPFRGPRQPRLNPFFVLVLKAKSLDARGSRMRRLLDGRGGDMSEAAQAARSKPLVHVVSAFTWVTETRTAGFWMDEEVVEMMLAEGGWEAWIWRTDTWDVAAGPASLDTDGGLEKRERWR